jgi:hypothetical protein
MVKQTKLLLERGSPQMKIYLGLPREGKSPNEKWAIIDTESNELIRDSSLTDDRLRTYSGGLRATDESDKILSVEPATDKTICLLRDSLQVAKLKLPLETQSLILETISFPSPGASGNASLVESVRLQLRLRLK